MRVYVAPLQVVTSDVAPVTVRLLQVGCSVSVFTNSTFKTRLHKGLCSATSECYRSDVAS